VAVFTYSSDVLHLPILVHTEAGHQPQENSYAFLIREQAARCAFSESFDLIKRMEKDGLQPRLRTYAPLLQGIAKHTLLLAALLHLATITHLCTTNTRHIQTGYTATTRARAIAVA
jgi:Pentacotripeptide-repeat region of PRORP